MTHVSYPYRIDGRGRTTAADDEAYVRELIEQVLFTSPGERVNRPEFGSGLLKVIFAPNSQELATTTQFMVQGALQQFVGDLIVVESVDVTVDDAKLLVKVVYLLRRTQEQRVAEFERNVP